MIKLLHAADLHLDSPFSALPPQQAAERRAAQRAQLGEIVTLCNDEACDLLLLSGDLDEGLESWLAAEGRTAREVCHDGRLATYTVHVYQCPAAG